MKATVIYADWSKIDRDTRLDVVGEGHVLDGSPELYYKVYTFCYNNGPVGPYSACDEMFSLFHMPGGLHEKMGVRSMSVGDVVVIDFDDGRTDVYVCADTDFEDVSYMPRIGSWLGGVE
jgi:hypothetical protein